MKFSRKSVFFVLFRDQNLFIFALGGDCENTRKGEKVRKRYCGRNIISIMSHRNHGNHRKDIADAISSIRKIRAIRVQKNNFCVFCVFCVRWNFRVILCFSCFFAIKIFSFPRWEGIAKTCEKAKRCEKDKAMRPSHSPLGICDPLYLPL